jgi:hypothetical protein
MAVAGCAALSYAALVPAGAAEDRGKRPPVAESDNAPVQQNSEEKDVAPTPVPFPATPGCPFRDKKLELIV